MSSTTDTAKSNNTSLLSRIFRRGSKPPATDAASTTSKDPLVHGQPMKSTSTEEHDLVGELMAKANTMGEDEFKAYLKEHKEEVEEMYRKQGGGIASGDWVSRDWATAVSKNHARQLRASTSSRASHARLDELEGLEDRKALRCLCPSQSRIHRATFALPVSSFRVSSS
ncbi:hypothetical protein CLCR_04334 [Cladophialophora carrionii]|uniref:Uncharacterized protein n=1 Tax=Cladophialophora carrionii TaxID=86049 RepID=A0A1C1CIZ2_9EURO|nr:hypothetical protein CLCR_04334 [Cladophialophora carrionii]